MRSHQPSRERPNSCVFLGGALCAALVTAPVTAAHADAPALCRAAIGRAEAQFHVPDAFLSAIGRVESGRPDPQTGLVSPWPWTINAEGQGSFFATQAEAVAAVRALQARGVRSIDVGCMQVNLMHHPDAFASLEQAFDPDANAAFAARLLTSLFAQMGSWPLAAAAYHSQTPTVGAAYQRRVLAEWAVPENKAPRTAEAAALPLSASSARPPPAAAADRPGAGPAFGRTSLFTSRAAVAGVHPGMAGRGLAAYRTMPIAFALRAPPRPG